MRSSLCQLFIHRRSLLIQSSLLRNGLHHHRWFSSSGVVGSEEGSLATMAAKRMLFLRDEILEVSRRAAGGFEETRVFLEKEKARNFEKFHASEPREYVEVKWQREEGVDNDLPVDAGNFSFPLFNYEDVVTWVNYQKNDESLRGVGLIDKTEKLSNSFLTKLNKSKLAAQVSLWANKTLEDSIGEVEELSALVDLMLHTCMRCGSNSGALNRVFVGNGKNAVVVPASNFPLLAVKDALWLILQGYRVLIACQFRFYRIFRELKLDHFSGEDGEDGWLQVMPLMSRKTSDCLQRAMGLVDSVYFTGKSGVFKELLMKSFDLSDYGGEVSGINKTSISGKLKNIHENRSIIEGLHRSICANNGELCSSTSVVEISNVEPEVRELLAKSLKDKDREDGVYGSRIGGSELRILKRSDKSKGINVILEPSSEGYKEYWDKTAMIVVDIQDGLLPTCKSLTHCVYGNSLDDAITIARSSLASNVYLSSVEEGWKGERVSGTGCKIPESAFGGMKSFTRSVFGNHDGVGTIQWLMRLVRLNRMNTVSKVKRSVYDESCLPEEVEEMMDYMDGKVRAKFVSMELGEILDVFRVFAENVEFNGPYDGQPLLGASEDEGRTSLITMKAIRGCNKVFALMGGGVVSIDDDLIKALVIDRLSPWKARTRFVLVGKKKTDEEPMKSFLRFARNKLSMDVSEIETRDGFTDFLDRESSPPYLFTFGSIRDEVFGESLICERGGFVYKGSSLIRDPFQLMSMMTTTQAWTIAFNKEIVDSELVRNKLREVNESEFLKEDWKGEDTIYSNVEVLVRGQEAEDDPEYGDDEDYKFSGETEQEDANKGEQ